MNRGVPPTPLNARTGLLTPPGMTRCAAASSAALRGAASRGISVVLTSGPLAQPARGVLRVVGDDEVRAGAADRDERLERGTPLVDPPAIGGRLEQRVLA